jgi:hypothetical protein
MSFLALSTTVVCPGPRLHSTDPWVGGQIEEVQFLFCQLKSRITDDVTRSEIHERLPLCINNAALQ